MNDEVRGGLVTDVLAIEEISKTRFREAMGSFAAGVTVITSIDEMNVPQGMTATAFSSVCTAPPLCLVCINQRTRTHQALVVAQRFAVSMLASSQQALSAHFASPQLDKFTGIDWYRGPRSGCPLVAGALTWIECSVEAMHCAGDHSIVLGRLLSIEVAEGAPLVYFRGAYSGLPVIDASRCGAQGEQSELLRQTSTGVGA